MSTPLLKLENISKYFGKVKALDRISLEVPTRSIIGLVGDNGAGKSTLLGICAGYLQPDEGKIYFKGKEVRFSSPQEARALGIEMVYQNLGDLIPRASIQFNFFLGREYCKRVGFFKVLDRKTMDRIVLESVKNIDIHLRSPKEPLERLSGGEKQSVAFARAAHFGSNLLLLDEPTSNLSVKETQKVLNAVQKLREKNGVSVIYVSHIIPHVYEVADKIVVLSRGRKIAEIKKEETTVEEIAKMIV
ncbi:MAG: ATP-binding cassette domain-containing protein [Candidatus Bathyarchaeia archaeon]